MRLRPLTLVLVAATAFPALAASPAHAASYRKADVERAVEASFKKVLHGGSAHASCAQARRNTSWSCRLKRPSAPTSRRFTLTVKAGGRWSTTKFSFPGFTAAHKLSGCCLRRR